MHFSKIAASVALLFTSLVAAAPQVLNKRSVGLPTDNPSFQYAILKVHNLHRRYHQVGKLEWDSTLASFAQENANKCVFQHSGGPYGENLFAIYPGYDDWYAGTKDGVNAWIYEVKNYDYNNPGFAADTGHFTQAVWKASTKIGCSWNTVDCDGAAYLFCEYDSPGNVLGEFPQNVFPPRS